MDQTVPITPIEYSVASTYMDIPDIFETPLLHKVLAWDTSQPVMGQLMVLDLPSDLMSDNTIHAQLFKLYANTQPVIKIVINCSFPLMAQGQVAFWWDPMKQTSITVPTPKNTKLQTRPLISMQPHVMINAAVSNQAILEIPFVMPQSSMTTNANDTILTLGNLYAHVFNVLRVATGQKAVAQLEVSVSFKGTKVKNPILPHTVITESREFPARPPLVAQAGLGDIGAKVGKAKNIATSAMGAYAHLKTGNFSGAASSASAGLGDLSSLLKDFNLDAPTSLTADHERLHQLDQFRKMRGPTSFVRLAADANTAYTDLSWKPSTGTELDLIRIAQIPSFITSYTLDTNSANGLRFLTQFVAPSCMNWSIIPESNPIAIVYDTTYLYAIARQFGFWRGGITYRLDAVKSAFHAFKIMLAFIPNAKPSDTTTITMLQAANYPNVIVDFHENNTFTFTAPHTGITARKRVANLNIGEYNPMFNYDTTMFHGTILGFLYSEVQANAAVSNTVELNLYIMGAKDIAFDTPKSVTNEWFEWDFANRYVPPLTEEETEEIDTEKPVRPKLFAQAGTDLGVEVLTGRTEDPYTDEIVLGTADTNTIFKYYPTKEQITSVLELIMTQMPYAVDKFVVTQHAKGFWYGRSNLTPQPTDVRDPNGTNVPPGLHTTLINRAKSPLHFFSWMYALHAGSMRVNFIPMTNRFDGALCKITYVFDDVDGINMLYTDEDPVTAFWGYPSQMTNLTQHCALSIELPYYSPFNALINLNSQYAPQTTRDAIFTTGQLLVELYANSQSEQMHVGPDYLMTVGAGDDFMFCLLTAPPRLASLAYVP